LSQAISVIGSATASSRARGKKQAVIIIRRYLLAAVYKKSVSDFKGNFYRLLDTGVIPK
jgi:hypothetical protein